MTDNSLHYASIELQENERFGIWHEMFAKKMAGFDISHADQRPFLRMHGFAPSGPCAWLATLVRQCVLYGGVK